MKNTLRLISLLAITAVCFGLSACCCIPFESGPSYTDSPSFDWDDNTDFTYGTTTTTEEEEYYTTAVTTTPTTGERPTFVLPTFNQTTTQPTTPATTRPTARPTTPATTRPTARPTTPTTTKAPAGNSSVINVAKLPKNPYTVPAPQTAATTLTKAVIHSITDSINSGEKDSYTFTAPRDGRYCLYLSNTNANIRVSITVYDSLGKSVGSNSYFRNESTLALTLNGGETYNIRISHSDGSGNYTLNIGQQTPTTNITAYTAVTDSMVFENQRNYYTFTPAIDGRYCFSLSNTKADVRTSVTVYDSLEKNIGSNSYFRNEGTLALTLEGGETYTICMAQSDGLGNYTLNIGKQTPTVDISAYSAVTDRITFYNQKNNYTFKTGDEGYYTFYLTNTNAGLRTSITVYDSLEKNVGSNSYFRNESVLTLHLDGNATYTIRMAHSDDIGNYTLNIGRQKTTVAVTDGNTVKDSLEFSGQRNVYRYTPKTSGSHTVTMSGMGTNRVQVIVKDSLDATVTSSSYVRDNSEVKFNATAGATYTVYVVYSSDVGNYTMTVK